MDQALGFAGTIGVKEFMDEPLRNTFHGEVGRITAANKLSSWLGNNPDLEVINIQYAVNRVLAVYRKELR